jgi:hypothetical protein
MEDLVHEKEQERPPESKKNPRIQENLTKIKGPEVDLVANQRQIGTHIHSPQQIPSSSSSETLHKQNLLSYFILSSFVGLPVREMLDTYHGKKKKCHRIHKHDYELQEFRFKLFFAWRK